MGVFTRLAGPSPQWRSGHVRSSGFQRAFFQRLVDPAEAHERERLAGAGLDPALVEDRDDLLDEPCASRTSSPPAHQALLQSPAQSRHLLLIRPDSAGVAATWSPRSGRRGGSKSGGNRGAATRTPVPAQIRAATSVSRTSARGSQAGRPDVSKRRARPRTSTAGTGPKSPTMGAAMSRT